MSNIYQLGCRAVVRAAVPILSISVVATAVLSSGAHAITSKHGCVEVTAQSINIRSKNSAKRGEVLTTARKGEVLAKRGPTCPIRRFWCPVRNTKGVEGWAAKEFIKNTECR
ncbi:MAG: SH3 domain-containing protein [Pseudomonadota bacterium]